RIIFSAIFSAIYGIKNSKNVYLVEQAEKNILLYQRLEIKLESKKVLRTQGNLSILYKIYSSINYN
ncbi:hypothetical protein, partial [Dialister invisus]|uniref:hypothetical protein n=1 Tax=Dialister invisus TaxID=218538 RepID=UPI003AF9B488